MKINVNEITVRDNRRKVNESKVSELSDSIKELGLLNPITVEEQNGKYILIAGAHRLSAVKKLGYSEIECNVVSFENSLLSELAEIDENLIRNELHYIDRADELAKRKRIYEQLYPETKHGGDRKSDKIKLQNLQFDKPTFVEDTAEKTNESKRSIYLSISRSEKLIPEIKEVIKEKDLPKYQADELTKMDEEEQKEFVELATENKVRDVKEFISIKKKEERRKNIEKLTKKTPELNTSNKYRVIYADPPWQYNDKQDTEKLGGAGKHYPTMSIQELCEMPVKDIAEDNSVLFMWTTSPLLEECFDVIKAWGFKYKTSFVWDKVKHNMGHYNSVRHEFLLICTRGSCTPDNRKLFDSVQSIERTDKHSEKPHEFYDIIEALYQYGNKIELFSRNKRKGWSSFGNDV